MILSHIDIPPYYTFLLVVGGMFRLVKINSDQQRELSETLGVSGLPTVFAVVGGKVTDRFVGMLPQEELQQFIVRAVTGYGGRVQEEQISNAELDAMTRKLANFAGLTSLSFKKLSLLKSKVDAILTEEDAFKEDGSPEDGLVKAMKIVKKAHADIRVKIYSFFSITLTLSCIYTVYRMPLTAVSLNQARFIQTALVPLLRLRNC